MFLEVFIPLTFLLTCGFNNFIPSGLEAGAFNKTDKAEKTTTKLSGGYLMIGGKYEDEYEDYTERL